MVIVLFAELRFLPAQICEEDQQSKKEICTVSDTTSKVVWHVSKFLGDNSPAILAAFTVFIAWFTLGLKDATVRLERATVDLVTGAEKTAERQLRAYVLVGAVEASNVKAGRVPSIRVEIMNYGQTPASNFSTWSAMGIDLRPPTQCPIPAEIDKRVHHPLAPSAVIYANPGFTMTLDEGHIRGFEEGSHGLYVNGGIDYEDAFGCKRWTKFHLFLGGPVGINGGAMAAYNEGNEYE